jgi:TolB-like protein
MIFRRLAVVLLVVAFADAVFAKDKLAVLPFTGGTAVEGETIAELFSFSNELNTVFAPIPRTSITRAVNKEQKFQRDTGMTDPDTIMAIGQEVGAKYVVAGNIGKLGDQNLLIISILKIDDLRQVAGDIQTYKDIEEIQDKLPEMAQNIIEAVEIDSTQLDKLAVTPVDLGENIDARMADTLAQVLSINLIKSRKYAIYPRTTTLEQAQTEYENQGSGITADGSMVDIGKGENPRFVLSVAARQLGTRNMFNAAIINLESGVQIDGRSVNYQTLDDGIAAMESLAVELAPSVTTGSSEIDRILAEAEAAAAEAGAKKKAEASSKPKRVKQSGGAVFGYGVLNLALGLGSLIQGDVPGWLVTFLSYGAAAGLVAWDLSLDYEYELMGIEFAGIPGAVGFGVAGFAIFYGFIRPLVVNNNRGLAEIMDRVDIAVVPRWDGRETIRLVYSVKF